MRFILRLLQGRSLSQLMGIRTNSIVVVCGCTGTGKSDLGIEIAKQFNGEIISADSMQIYQGLDIVTNKVTVDEMQGIPHHMMSFLDPCQSSYNVHQFRASSLQLIADLWSRDKLPVIVGGTSYYVESILYQNYLIQGGEKIEAELQAKLDAADDEELYAILSEVDPSSALQIHRNNRQRVMRALQIFYSTGKRKSEHLAQQRAKASEVSDTQNHLGGMLHFKKTLLLNLDAQSATLDERLDKRVSKMVDKGLRNEMEEFYDMHKESLSSHGIAKSIGLKEFIPYLELDELERRSDKGVKLFDEGCDLLRAHSKQYCRRQRKWMYNRILHRTKTREVPQFVNLDASTDFFERVFPFALDCVRRFLVGQEAVSAEDLSKPHPALMILPLRDNLADLGDEKYQLVANQIFFCEICQRYVHGQKSWEAHTKGRAHRAVLAKKKVEEEEQNEGSPNAACC